MPAKILLCGAVNGEFEALKKRVESVNSKAGPFDALLCVGRFFAEGDAAAEVPSFVKACVDGSQQLVVPTYFIGASGLGAEAALIALASAAPVCNLRYLGECGIAQVAGGLQVAYYDTERVKDSSLMMKKIENAEGDLDLLLTCEWPANVTSDTPPVKGTPAGRQDCAEIAMAARPRYHVSSSPSLFYQRAPYVNPDVGAGKPITRFISCAAVGNASKAKWLHALGLKPVAQMTEEELQAQPADCTTSPYLSGSKKHTLQESDDGQSWRWSASKKPKRARGPAVPVDAEKSIYVKNLPYSAEEEDLIALFSRVGKVADVRWTCNAEGKRHGWAHVQFDSKDSVRAACEMTGQALMGRELTIDVAESIGKPELNLGKPVKDCWFCLSNEQADVHLVVDILEEAYLAVDKGPINDTHVLVIPVEHYPNLVTTRPGALAEVERLVGALRKAYASRGLELVGFERYLGFHARGGNHCHINFLGIGPEAAKTARSVFSSAATDYGFSFVHMPSCQGETGQAELKGIVGDAQYFQAFLPDGSRLVHAISGNKRHPMHFGREVLAKLAGEPAKSDWRLCKARDGAEEEARTAAFRTLFESHSPAAQN